MMKQRIVFPARFNKVTSNYDRDSDKYGICLLGQTSILRSSGQGQVRSIGFSPEYQHFVCVIYNDVVTITGEEVGSILLRYCNLSHVDVKKWQKVFSSTVIGTVQPSPHKRLCYSLYVEADTDVKYPNHTPSLLKPSGDLKVGLRGSFDTTFDPLLVLYK